MKIDHPFEIVPSGSRNAALVLFLALALICLLVFFFVLDPPLRTALSPLGIVSFELAWTVETASAIMGAWDYPTSLYAAFGLGFDFLFMLSYACAVGLGTLWAARRMGARLSDLGKWLGWGVLLAALLDALENIFLFTIMTRGNYPPFALLASIVASLKFLLLFCGICYALMGLFVRQRPRSQRRGKSKEFYPTSIDEK